MKNFYSLVILFLFILCSNSLLAQGQPSRKRIESRNKETVEKNKQQPSNQNRQTAQVDLMEKLWFGGNVIFGYQQLADWSQFVIGITPMVGYKITPQFSVGPRLELEYISLRFRNFDGWQSSKNFDVGASVFARYKFLDFLFAHVEAGFSNTPFLARDAAGNFEFVDQRTNPILIGLGYNAGGFEIALLFDLNTPEDSPDQGIDYRLGFTYNF